LRQFGDAVDHVDQVKDHTAFGAHHQIKIPEADIEVDDNDLIAKVGKRGTQRSGRRGLADAAFA
jgi:hypothetical protein